MRQVLHKLGWQVASNIGVALIAGVYVLYLGARLGAEQFGLFALVLAIPTFSFAAIDLRIQEATARFLVQLKAPAQCAAYLRHFWRIDVVARILVGVVLVVATPLLLVYVLRGHAGAGLLLVATVGMFLGKVANSAAIGVLRACDLFVWHARLLLLGWAVKLGVTIACVQLLSGGVLMAIAVSVAVDALVNFATISRARRAARTAGWAPHAEVPPLSADERSSLRRFLMSNLGISTSDSVLRELDTALVGMLLSLESVGLYRMAKNIVQMIWRVVDPVYILMMPEFSRQLAAGNDAAVHRLGRMITLTTFGVVGVIALAMVAVLPHVAPLVLGPSFAGLTTICGLMVIGVLLGGPFIWVHAAWIAEGRPDRQLIANVSGAVVAAIAYVSLTPQYSVRGAAVAFAISLSLPFVLSRLLWQYHSNGKRR